MCYLGTDKTVKHKASLKVGIQITIQNVKKYWTIQVLANKYRKKKHSHVEKKKQISDIFKCCTASTTATWLYTCSRQCFLMPSMTHQSVEAYESLVRQNTNICPDFKGTVFTFSTVDIKQVQVFRVLIEKNIVTDVLLK